jgi:putative transposase
MRKNTYTNKRIQEIMPLELDEIARIGAQQMLKNALEAEIQNFLDTRAEYRTVEGLQGHVRNGFHRERGITVGSGTIMVEVPRTRNRLGTDDQFVSKLIPPYLRRSLKIDEAIPLFYLHGLSNNDFIPCLEKLFGEGISGISSANITRMKKIWQKDYLQWRKRDLSGKKYCYVWVDGIYFNVRHDDSRLCTLIVMGALENGKKELISVEGGYRESSESWASLLRDLSSRGMRAPRLFIGDGALGFWKAVRSIYPKVKWQRCWVHKIANILDKLPKSIQPKAKSMLHDIYKSPVLEEAKKSYKRFLKTFEAKYPKATECLSKDIDKLLTFYEFPAQHWNHIRTTNPIESTFSTIRLRTKKTRGHGTLETTLLMVFKLAEKASKRWHRLRAHELIGKVISGVKFPNGEQLKKAA